MTTTERFWTKVEKSEEAGGCWIWSGALTDSKGTFAAAGRTRYAHRVAWELTHDEQLDDKDPLTQLCETPGCVNPAHWKKGHKRDGTPPVQRKLTEEDVLRVRQQWLNGTLDRREMAQELDVSASTLDYITANRSWSGGPHPPGYLDALPQRGYQSLSDVQVYQMRQSYRDNLTLSERDLAKQFDVARSVVHDLLALKSRAGDDLVPAGYAEALAKRAAESPARKRKLTKDDVIQIRALAEEGKARAAIAEEFGVSVSTVTDIVNRRTWKKV